MRSLFMIAAFALAGAGAVLTAMTVVSRIEVSSSEDLLGLFEQEQLDWVEVRVDGLQVELTGTAPDEGTRFRALTLAGQVVDATHIIDAMDVDPGRPVQPPDFSLEILRNDRGVSLIGLAPQDLDRQSLADLVEDIAADGEISDLLQTADYPVPPGWEPALDYALEALADLPRSKISVAPGRVSITAISDSADQKAQLEARLKRALPSTVLLDMAISAPRPVITPFTLRFILDETGGRFDACSAYNAEGRDKILKAAMEAGLQGTADCRIGLGTPSPRWSEAVSVGLSALADLGGGSITFSDADVTLVAAQGTDQRSFDRVVGALEGRLPDVFSLDPILPQQETTDEAGETVKIEIAPEFVAALTEDGELRLGGRVADERQREAVISYSRGRFARAEVVPAMRAVAGVPDGWAGRVFAGLEALNHLKTGSVIVETAHVVISGVTHQPDAKDEISRILGEALQGRGTFAIDVTFIEIKEPEVILPSPRECVDTINAILADNKITFDPGSADIDRRVRGTLDRIAEVMKDCTAVPMEIAGHTDSQGRESMNLGLSQRRAEAVLEALMARRVLVANLTARGYGEGIPIADNDTEEGRETNRRIEFTLRVLPGTEDDGVEAVEEVAAPIETEPDAEPEAENEDGPKNDTAPETADDGDSETTAEEPEADTAEGDEAETGAETEQVADDAPVADEAPETAETLEAETDVEDGAPVVTVQDPDADQDAGTSETPPQSEPEVATRGIEITESPDTLGTDEEIGVEPVPEITVTVIERPAEGEEPEETAIIPAPRPDADAATDTEDDT